jgi:acetyl esterase/lipase
VTPNGQLRIESDVVFGKGGEQELLLDVYHPPPRTENGTAIIHIFGGGYTRGTKQDRYLTVHAAPLAERGYVCVSASYRHAPGARWPSQLYDTKAAIRWTRANAGRLGVDAAKIALCGYSAGGHLALIGAGSADRPELEGEGGNVGVSSAVAACIAFYPARASLRLQGPSLLMADDATEADHRNAEPLTHVRGDFPPTLILQGTNDPFIELNTRLHVALQAAGAASELHVFAGLPHIFNLFPEFTPICTDLCDAFLDRFVVNPRPFEFAGGRPAPVQAPA